MAENKNMELSDEIMEKIAGGANGPYKPKYNVGDRVYPHYHEAINFGEILALWWDDTKDDYYYAVKCIMCNVPDKTIIFAESDLW